MMKLADFKQQTDEGIAHYLERAANLVTKSPTKEFDIGMAKCASNKQSRASEIDQTRNPSDRRLYVYFSQQAYIPKLASLIPLIPQYGIRLIKLKTATNSVQVQNELLQQLLVNNASTLPAILERMRTLTNANT